MGKRRVVGPTAWILGGSGLFIGAVAAWLVSQGNPGNMGLCIACFLRDITGFFVGGVTNQGAVAYIRPEIIGIILGAMGAALVTREFRSRGGSAPLVRFVLGFIFMSAALVFLGCTRLVAWQIRAVRMLLTCSRVSSCLEAGLLLKPSILSPISIRHPMYLPSTGVLLIRKNRMTLLPSEH